MKLVNLIRKIYNFGRYAEDMIGEMIGDFNNPGKHLAALPVFSEGFPFTLKNPRISHFQWQSGDIVLMRGQRHNSAAIARIGDTDVQFSHLAIVYKDKLKGKPYLVESLIEKGLVVNDLEKTLAKGSARFVVYRFSENINVAANAAEILYRKAYEAKQSGKIIEYDFSMSMDCSSGIYFC